MMEGTLTALADNALQTGLAERLGARAGAASAEDVERVAKDFEAMVIAQMLRPMFEGLDTDGPFGGGSGERMMRSLLLDQYGETIAESGRMGIAEPVRQALLDLQEVKP